MEKRQRNSWLVLLACVALFILWLGARDFYSRGEPREVLVAQSMLQSGNWILGSGYGGAIPSKPPLAHWLIAAASLPVGEISPFTARLPSALFCTAFLLAFFVFLSVRLGDRPALLSTFILMMSVDWYRSATTGRVDMLVSVLICGGLLRLLVWEERGLKGVSLSSVILFTGAMLAKGPMGVVLPGLIFFAYLLWRRVSVPQVFVSCLKVFLPALLLGSIWYAFALKGGGEAFSTRVYYENVARFLGSMEDEPHRHSVFYLFEVLPVGLLPWALLIVPAFLRDFPAIRRVGALFRREHDALWRLSLCSIVIVFLFYAIPSSKRSVYLLPLYPFICIFGGLFLTGLQESGLKLVRAAGLILAGILMCLLVFLASTNPANWFQAQGGDKTSVIPGQIAGFIGVFAEFLRVPSSFSGGLQLALFILPFLLSAAFIIALWRRRFLSQVVPAVFVLVFSIELGLNAAAFPLVANRLSSRRFARQVSDIVAQDARLYSFGNEFYGLSFYLKRGIYRVPDTVQEGDVIFSYVDNLQKLQGAVLKEDQSVFCLSESDYGVENYSRRLGVYKVAKRESKQAELISGHGGNGD